MAWWNPISWANAAYDSDWDKGWDAADEFTELVEDDELTDSQLDDHWKAVYSGHNQEYIDGYEDYFQPHPVVRAFQWLFGG